MTSLLSLNEIIAVSLSILLLNLYYKVYKGDTEVSSLFFTIDTSRTMRFMLSYIIAIALFVIGLYFILPFAVFALVAAISIAIFIALNGVIIIFNIVLFLFGTQISFINFGILSFIINFNLVDLTLLYFDEGLIIIQILLFVISPSLAGWHCGNYAEDKYSIKIVGFTWLIFLGSQALVWQNLGNEFIVSPFIEGIIIFNYFIFIYFGSLSYNSKSKKEEYDLSEIKGWRYFVYFIVGFISLIPLLAATTLVWFDGLALYQSGEVIIFLAFSFIGLVSLFFVIFNILFYLRGDHSINQKITEIENREDLIEMAKEFRELDPSNIDDFVRKSTSGLM